MTQNLPPLPPELEPPPPAPAPPPVQYIYTGAPARRSDDLPGSGCSRGCLWVLGGSAGCLIVIVVLVGALVLSAGLSIDGFLREISRIFDGGSAQTRSITIPTVDRVNRLSTLTTTRYNYANIVTTEIDMPQVLRALYGDRLVMIAVGHIQAGVDLSALGPEALVYDEAARTLTLQLPPPRLQECFLDESKTQIVERATGLFAQPATSLDLESRRYALRQFRNMALEDGILAETNENAVLVVRDFLGLLLDPADEITLVIVPSAPEAEAVLPDTCR